MLRQIAIRLASKCQRKSPLQQTTRPGFTMWSFCQAAKIVLRQRVYSVSGKNAAQNVPARANRFARYACESQKRSFSYSLITSEGNESKPSASPQEKEMLDWSVEDVVAWAKAQGLSKKTQELLAERDFSGRALLLVQSASELIERHGFPSAAADVLWAALNQLMSSNILGLLRGLSDKRGPLTSTFGSQMPVVQRDDQVAQVWRAFIKHYSAWKDGDKDRASHPRCFAYGPPGSGKTRFGVELIPLLKSFGRELVERNQATDNDKELLALLEGAVFIHVTFAAGTSFSSTESLQTAIVTRGMQSLFSLSLSLPEIYTLFGDYFKNLTLLSLLQLAKQEFGSKTGAPTMVYIHMDEFNALFDKSPALFKEAIDMLSGPLSAPPANIFYTVLFTGTAYTEMKAYGVSDKNPAEEVPMMALQPAGIKKLVTSMHQRGHLSWLDPDWENNRTFLLSLLTTGGVPRGIEYLLATIDEVAKVTKSTLPEIGQNGLQFAIQSAELKLESRYSSAFASQPNEIYAEALAIGILGEPVLLDAQLKLTKEKTYGSLLQMGSIVLKKFTSGEWKIQLPSMWLHRYQKHFKQFMSKATLDELTSISPDTWSRWERVTAVMLMLRTNSIKLLSRPDFTIGDLFPGAKKAAAALLERRIITWENFYQCKDSPYQFLKNPRTTLVQGKKMDHFSCGTVWINAVRGPGLDCWTIYKNNSTEPSYTVVFVQNKFTEAGKTQLYTQQVIETYQKLAEMWHQLNSTDGKLADYSFVLVVISNRQLVENHVATNDKIQLPPQQLAEAINNQEILANCILYDEDTIAEFFTTFSNQLICSVPQLQKEFDHGK